MSKFCEICGRGPRSGNRRSHSNIATRRKFNLNLQVKKIGGKKVKICARCIKTRSKTTA
ncbi:MAG: 50S ribosomal protein L28 [Candidatus Moranbacteria bacterium RIFCSPHIGHO2_02_FULL_40_12b]|nr:MAG: 50S ribosomal protein L28 [Candidatus Moranbacteria bacterium RIFCSPHIGHO2_02_FULL_40_12b]